MGHDANSRVHLCSRATDDEACWRLVHRKRVDLRHNRTMNFSRRHFATERRKGGRGGGEREGKKGREGEKEAQSHPTNEIAVISVVLTLSTGVNCETQVGDITDDRNYSGSREGNFHGYSDRETIIGPAGAVRSW